MVAPSTKLIALIPVIIFDHQIGAENRSNIRTELGAALALFCLAYVPKGRCENLSRINLKSAICNGA
jgi:hypothetical protein